MTTTEQQSQLWTERIQEILHQPSQRSQISFIHKSIQKQLEVNRNDINEDELENAIETHKSNKAAGADQITAELLKYDGKAITKTLTRVLNAVGKDNRYLRIRGMA